MAVILVAVGFQPAVAQSTLRLKAIAEQPQSLESQSAPAEAAAPKPLNLYNYRFVALMPTGGRSVEGAPASPLAPLGDTFNTVPTPVAEDVPVAADPHRSDLYKYRFVALMPNARELDAKDANEKTIELADSASPTSAPVEIDELDVPVSSNADRDIYNYRFVALMPNASGTASQEANAPSEPVTTEALAAVTPSEREEPVVVDSESLDLSYHRFVALMASRQMTASEATLPKATVPATSASTSTALSLDRSLLVAPEHPTHIGVPAEAYSSAIESHDELARPTLAARPSIAGEPALHFDGAPAVLAAPCDAEAAELSMYGCPYFPTQSGTPTICGVDCGSPHAPCCATWKDARPIPWSMFGPGEYVGPARPEHISTYYLRVNDLITLTYIASRQKHAERYRIGVGDRLRLESASDEMLDRELIVQPDGDISLPLIGEVPAAGKTVKELREDLVARYRQFEEEPVITVTTLDVNIAQREILNAVTSQSRLSGQAVDLRVTPEGTIQAPGLGSVYVQGLTLEELRTELEARYAATFGVGLLVSPALAERATSYVFVGGEVRAPARYTLEGPTTVMQAIAMAGGWNNGGNVRQVVVFRRDENWCLKATRIDLRRPLYGKDPCPVNDVWLRDNDLVIVPKSMVLCATDLIDLYFTKGVYSVFPITFVYDLSRGSTIVPVP